MPAPITATRSMGLFLLLALLLALLLLALDDDDEESASEHGTLVTSNSNARVGTISWIVIVLMVVLLIVDVVDFLFLCCVPKSIRTY